VILVGNKSDLEHERVVSTERGRRLASQLGKKQRVVHANAICSAKVQYTISLTQLLLKKSRSSISYVVVWNNRAMC